MFKGVLDGQACSWNKSLPTWESCYMQILQARQFSGERDDYIHAFVAYFDVSFTKCHKLMGFSTGPRSRATHWKQTVLYLEDVLTICEGETIIGSMTVAPNKKNPRDVDIMVKYSLSGRRCVVSRVQFYKMR
ncbi:hypothetical protein ES319_A10G173100v1 [Gossypium barbadense]|uniref:Protein arginine N-methyltransferase domain-containing protein n=5 Tax=Gossypium TaxID=3633 RepID=A0A5J5U4D4_GOSBA|nr:hypothetical protein ES319_A10G173100v1 [Gossypium barbadense]TYG77616.1 hypothetical protein ES288_D03G208600v1 [Gossypium darwinii]TYG91321.1 hypothetical protein ES288_A12G252700v1 [Gossypium darwinii]